MDSQARLTELLEALIKGVLRIRLVAIMLTMLALGEYRGDIQPLMIALVVALCLSVVPLLWWSTIGVFLRRHPAILVVDVIVTLGVLAVAGPQSPFFYFTLGTAALGGLLYRWVGAVVFSAIMVAGYAFMVVSNPGALSIAPTFHNQFGIPALYPIVGATCAGIRVLLERLLDTEIELARTRSVAAAASERTRLARQMHDSLGKTLQGVRLAASALPVQAERAPASAVSTAAQVIDGVDMATVQARELIAGLRDDVVEEGTCLRDALQELVSNWSAESGVEAGLEVDGAVDPGAELVGPLCAAVMELLQNVDRHANAGKVRVRVHKVDTDIAIDVQDDGVGFTLPEDLADLERGAHYGLVGVTERLAQVEAQLTMDSAPGTGTRAQIRVSRCVTNGEAAGAVEG